MCEFTDRTGDFVFNEKTESFYIRLNMWDEPEGKGRLWLVDSGEYVRFDKDDDNRISMEDVETFVDWLNSYLVQTKWKDKQLSVEGKIVFYNDMDHDIVAIIVWCAKSNSFQIKSHDFSK